VNVAGCGLDECPIHIESVDDLQHSIESGGCASWSG
jgi:hypothetical protein